MDYRPPSIRQRFVARARYLRDEHRPFRDAMFRIAEEWNAVYPEYAVRARGWPPSPEFPGPRPYDYPLVHEDMAHPPLLRAAMEAVPRDEHGWFDYHQMDHGGRLLGAESLWRQRIEEQCLLWWPQQTLLLWVPGKAFLHPAARFVSGALLWRFEALDPEWIADLGTTIVTFAYDPCDALSSPFVEGLQAEKRSLWRGLTAALESDGAIGREQLFEVWRQASRDGDAARRQAETKQSPDRKYVFIFPGMTGTDWRALEARVVAETRSDEQRIYGYAEDLLRTGNSVRSVAGTLGLSADTVSRMKTRLDQA